ncbi:MAG TPA: hypothetical protein VEY91_13770 [Candidatus Limnocylindria bacterium]|nr:hypothetical protein [Candidatus Limnocylindria bacterium]
MIPTVWSTLFDSEALPSEAERLIERSSELQALQHDIRSQVDATFWASARSAIADGLRQMLNVSLLDVLLRGWRSHPGLQKQLKSGDDRNRVVLFELGEHEITSKHRPQIEIRQQNRLLGSLSFDLDLKLMLQLARLQLQEGKLLRVSFGACSGYGRLKLGAAELSAFRLRDIEMPAQVSLGRGVSINA